VVDDEEGNARLAPLRMWVDMASRPNPPVPSPVAASWWSRALVAREVVALVVASLALEVVASMVSVAGAGVIGALRAGCQ